MSGMVVGFTGTGAGVSDEQLRLLTLWFAHSCDEMAELHHGDCVGADAQAHALALAYAVPVVQHPPINPIKRAWCRGGTVLPPREYLQRDRDIVAAAQVLVACPATSREIARSGTWYTVRQARLRRVPVWLITPDGKAGFE